MKKILLSLLLLLAPAVSYADFSAGFSAQTATGTTVYPTAINGAARNVQAAYFTGTSTATSSFTGGVTIGGSLIGSQFNAFGGAPPINSSSFNISNPTTGFAVPYTYLNIAPASALNGTTTGIDISTSVLDLSGKFSAYGIQSGFELDNFSGTKDNGYAFYGAPTTLTPSVTNLYGAYMTGENFDYFSGKVGVGTTSPGQNLSVAGNAQITGTTTSSCFATSTAGPCITSGTGGGTATFSTNPFIATFFQATSTTATSSFPIASTTKLVDTGLTSSEMIFPNSSKILSSSLATLDASGNIVAFTYGNILGGFSVSSGGGIVGTSLNISSLSNTLVAVDSAGNLIATTTSAGGVTAVTGSGNISSTGGATPNITFTGTLPIANGGTNSTTIGASSTVALSNGTSIVYVSTSSLGISGGTLSGGTTGQNAYWTSASTLGSEATGTISAGTGISVSGTPSVLLSGTTIANTGVLSIGGLTGTVSTSSLGLASANATISGTLLGGTLPSLTSTDSTLTFSSISGYNGTTARTVGLNLGSVNTWTGGQTFGNATTTNLGVTGMLKSAVYYYPDNSLMSSGGTVSNIYYPGTGGASELIDGNTGNLKLEPSAGLIDSAGNAGTANQIFTKVSGSPQWSSNSSTTLASTSILAITGITGSTQCLHVNTTGQVTGTGSDCGAGGGTNFLSNSGANTFLNTGTNLQAPTFAATSTTGTSTILNALTVGTTTSASNSQLTVVGNSNFGNSNNSVAFNVDPTTGNIGIGTTSAASQLIIQAVVNINPFTISSSTGAGLFAVDPTGAIYTGGGLPTVSNGTLDAHANDQSGMITDPGSLTGFTLTFSKAKPWAPHCVVSDNSTAFEVSGSSTPTTIVFTINTSFTGVVTYACFQ